MWTTVEQSDSTGLAPSKPATKPRPKRALEVTQSELNTFRTCRKKWWFRYHEGLVPLRTHRALAVGSIVHSGIEAMYEAIRDGQADLASATRQRLSERMRAWRDEIGHLDDEQEAEHGLAYDEARTCLDLFVAAFGEADRERFAVVGIEQVFSVTLRDGRSHAIQRGMLDVLLRDRRTGALWLGEHKTTRGHATGLDARLDIDGQVRSYLNAVRTLYPHDTVGGVLLSVVRKKAPSEPVILKGGAVSAAAIDTTAEIYRRALAAQTELGMAVSDKQMSRLDSLPEGTGRWAHRVEEWIDTKQVDQWLAEATADVRLIRASRNGRLLPTRNPSSCTLPWAPPCPYRSVCVEDHQSVRESEYRLGVLHEELGEEENGKEENGKDETRSDTQR